MPKPKYRKPASENTSEIWPRDAAKSRCSDSTNALNVYALPNPTNVTANAAATTYQPWKTRDAPGRFMTMLLSGSTGCRAAVRIAPWI